MKRRIALLLVIFIVILNAAGCTMQKSQVDSSSSANQKSELKENDKKQIEPFWIMYADNFSATGYPQKLEDDLVRQNIQEKSGFEYYVEYATSSDYNTKLSLYQASGKYPDMWLDYGRGVVASKEGTIIPLDDLLEKYGQDLKKFYHGNILEIMKHEGKLWALPSGYNLSRPGNEAQTWGLLIRTDWLNKLGLKVPETLDEYYEAVKAFTTQDPDGNGEHDTYGIGTYSAVYFNQIFTAFGVNYHGDGFWHERDGQLVNCIMTDEFEEALKLLVNWYKEGLIDPEFVLLNSTEFKSKILNNKIGSTYWHVFTAEEMQNQGVMLEMIYPVIGPYGHRGNGIQYATGEPIVISSKCKQPELAMQFLNWFAKDDNHLLLNFGVEGRHWEWADEKHNSVRLIGTAEQRKAEGLGTPFYEIIDRLDASVDVKYLFKIFDQ